MPPGEHSKLGGSGAHRWMECPGSVRLEEQAPPEEPSEYAIEGTTAHGIAEHCLREEDDADSLIGYTSSYGVVVTQEMADAVQVYLDYVRSRPGKLGIELRVSLEKLDPPVPMFGTADAVRWDAETRTLEVIDLKYGEGVIVHAQDNPQLLYYALGTVLFLGIKPDRIVTTIVQPRAYRDEPVDTAEYTWDDLVAFKERLMEAAHATMEPNAPVGPVGEHCKWCRAKPFCPAQQENALVVAQDEFGTLAEDGPPPPEALTDEQLREVLEKAGIVEDWIKSIRDFVQSRLEAGEEFPGYKLVEGRRRRSWRDEEEAEEWLKQRYKVGEVYKKKVISPYQAEKLVKSRPRLEIPDEMIVTHPGAPKLVPEDHHKPAINSGEEFPTLEDPTNE